MDVGIRWNIQVVALQKKKKKKKSCQWMRSAWNLFIGVFIIHAQRRDDFPCSMCPCVCGPYMHVECVWDFFFFFFCHVLSVWETGNVLIGERKFALMSLQSEFTWREIWFLTLHCFYCCQKMSEAYTISLLCICTRVMFDITCY